jgi:primosomal protein N' (replication factor Y)
VLRVAIDAPLRHPFDYLAPDGLSPASVPLGVRVRVPVGRREAIGMVVERAEQSEVDAAALKSVRQVLDATPLIDPALMQLLRWTADYYHHPLGEVIAAALPRALRDGAPCAARAECWQGDLPAGIDAIAVAALRRAPRQQALLARLSQSAQPVSAAELDGQLPGWRDAARALVRRGWIERLELDAESEARRPAGWPARRPVWVLALQPARRGSHRRCRQPKVLPSRRSRPAPAAMPPGYCRALPAAARPRSTCRCAARTLARGEQRPGAGAGDRLTPQLVQRFRARLDVDIAVLHSGLSDAGERLAAWRAAHAGGARRARHALGGVRTDAAARADRGGRGARQPPTSSTTAAAATRRATWRWCARSSAVYRWYWARPRRRWKRCITSRLGRYRGLTLPRRDDQALAPRLALIDLRAHAVHAGCRRR